MLRDQLPILIGETPLRSVDITAASGQTRTAVNRCLWRLHHKGKIHVAAWHKERHAVAAMYKWGPGIDAPRPPRENPGKSEKRYRDARVAEDPNYYRKLYARRKARPAAPAVVLAPLDSLFSSWALRG